MRENRGIGMKYASRKPPRWPYPPEDLPGRVDTWEGPSEARSLSWKRELGHDVKIKFVIVFLLIAELRANVTTIYPLHNNRFANR